MGILLTTLYNQSTKSREIHPAYINSRKGYDPVFGSHTLSCGSPSNFLLQTEVCEK